MLQRLKLVQPNLDTKPGAVSRDLFVDIQADQIERLYRSMAIVSEKQSLATATGRDLDRIASNFGVPRRSPMGIDLEVRFKLPELMTHMLWRCQFAQHVLADLET
jgi:uncharacterized phage protein gp47/JayE